MSVPTIDNQRTHACKPKSEGKNATIQIMMHKPAPLPVRRKSSQPAPPTESASDKKRSLPLPADSGEKLLRESPDLIEALSNPLLYQRPHLLPALQALIHALEVAHNAVEAYAAGEYMTDSPVTVAIKRAQAAWTAFMSPLATLNGPKVDKASGLKNGGWNEEEDRKRKSVGKKLLGLAMQKQRCIDAGVKKLQLSYEEGSASARQSANRRFDAALVELIRFATLIATIEHALNVAIEGVSVKMIAEGDMLVELHKWEK